MTTDIKNIGRECMALRSRMAARTITRAYDNALKPLGLRITQFTVLACIATELTDSISSLADYMAVERTTLTRNLQLLEKKGLIRIEDEGYRRSRKMRLTEEGAKMLKAAIPIWEQTQDELKQKLGTDQWNMVSAGLNILTKSA